MKVNSAFNIAQNERGCVVFGMPKEAIDIGAVDRVSPLDLIATLMLEHAKDES